MVSSLGEVAEGGELILLASYGCSLYCNADLLIDGTSLKAHEHSEISDLGVLACSPKYMPAVSIQIQTTLPHSYSNRLPNRGWAAELTSPQHISMKLGRCLSIESTKDRTKLLRVMPT